MWSLKRSHALRPRLGREHHGAEWPLCDGPQPAQAVMPRQLFRRRIEMAEMGHPRRCEIRERVREAPRCARVWITAESPQQSAGPTLPWPQCPRLRKQGMRALRSSPKRCGRRLLYNLISSNPWLLELWPEYPDSLRRSFDAVGHNRSLARHKSRRKADAMTGRTGWNKTANYVMEVPL